MATMHCFHNTLATIHVYYTALCARRWTRPYSRVCFSIRHYCCGTSLGLEACLNGVVAVLLLYTSQTCLRLIDDIHIIRLSCVLLLLKGRQKMVVCETSIASIVRMICLNIICGIWVHCIIEEHICTRETTVILYSSRQTHVIESITAYKVVAQICLYVIKWLHCKWDQEPRRRPLGLALERGR